MIVEGKMVRGNDMGLLRGEWGYGLLGVGATIPHQQALHTTHTWRAGA